MSNDFLSNLVKAAEETGKDHTKVVAGGGGGGAPPAEGVVQLRLIGYVELGKKESEYKGVKKLTAKVRLYFQAFGKKYPPKVIDGVEYPIVIVVEENLSFTDKSAWPKLFAKLNYDKAAKHPTDCLGKAYLATIRHKKWARKGEDRSKSEMWTGLDVLLKGEDGSYTIRPPQIEVLQDDELVMAPVNVPPATVPYKGFLWDKPSMEQWQSIYIDGEYPARTDDKGNITKPATSKNVIQLAIRAATNYAGSPINHLLAAGGVELDLGGLDPDETRDEADDAPPATPKADPLAGAAKTGRAAANFDDMNDDIPF